MSTQREPRRWSEGDAPQLSRPFLEALSRAREEGPSAESRTRTWAALEAARTSQPTAALPAKHGPVTVLAGAGAMVIGVGIAAWLTLHPSASPAVAPTHKPAPSAIGPATHDLPWVIEPATSGPIDARARGGVTRRGTPAAESGNAIGLGRGAAAQRALPRANASSRASSSAVEAIGRASTGPSTEPENGVGPAQGSELELLTRARRVLLTAPVRALALADEHERSYPAGAFVQERELLAIDALERLGRKAEAAVRSQRFFVSYPKSAYRKRIEVIIGTP
jgi:hypothetical protein